MIDVEATIEGKKVFISFIYGDLVIDGRESFWDRLNQISLTRHGPWLMIGDFNELTGNHGKRGGRRRSESSFLPFKRMLDSCGMLNFPYKGNSMSWVGYRRSGKVQCRLDRAVGNEDWFQEFSHTTVEYLKLWGSDHRPVLARISSKFINVKRNFKFDKRWLGKTGLKASIIEGWDPLHTSEQGDVYSKISSCRQAILRWKKTNKSNTVKKIEEIKAQLEQNQTDGNGTSEEALKLKWDLCSAFRDEELYWRQKSRVTWLREGDRNTKLFHATTKQRRARNRIIKLKKEDGSWAETDKGIEKVATEYFSPLQIPTTLMNLTDT
ncbi:unnamed protein product [Microthlaspi erraticum]|uniref:Endonuclease/exonuclease/phosphatase domain-containing protein n=1 Tax=Microthlaspi erraticum TaxID=1685480 RepID=A0A6D2L0Y1_9BRAS|nr:unnamed protein product [Microthlaspi erraticum]